MLQPGRHAADAQNNQGDNDDDDDDIETLIADALNQMSVQEREQVQEEIHGVVHHAGSSSLWRNSSSISSSNCGCHNPDRDTDGNVADGDEEEEERNAELLHCMQEAIEAVHHRRMTLTTSHHRNNNNNNNSCSGYAAGMALGSAYIYDTTFRLKFIRAEQDPALPQQQRHHVAERAAGRFHLYLDLLYRFFGPEALLRPLSLVKDFTDADDLAFMKEGDLQLLPSRDRAGRRVASIFIVDGHSFPTIETRVCSVLYAVY